MQDQTMEYLMDSNIRCKYQPDFRKNYSTDNSLSYLADNILTTFDSVLPTEMIYKKLLTV